MNQYASILLAAALGFGITALLGFPVIPWLRKLKIGQTILDIGPKWHKSKQGTPTMGGLLFAAGTVGALVITLLLDALLGGDILGSGAGSTAEGGIMRAKLWSGLLMSLAFLMVGFMDDYVKVVKKRNKGLSIGQKTLVQLLIIFSYLASLYLASGRNPSTYVPFVGEVRLGVFHWIFGAMVLYATTNAVNFTDGLDGLCTSVTTTAAIAFGVVAALRGLLGFSMMASALAGACVGFLMWNRYPAKVIMGDTGSMFLGGMMVALAYAVDCPLLLLPIGIIYVIEGLSDVLQIGYYRLTGGKRIFKMAPIHHHFEMVGWSEKKIVKIFTAVNILGCAAGIAVMYFAEN